MDIEDKHISWLFFIVVLLILGIGGAFAIRSIFFQPQPINIEIKYVRADSDSITPAEFYSKAQMDSVIGIFKSKEESLNTYQQHIEEEKWEKDYKNILIYGVSIIIAIAGFFGYKSIHDVKKESHEIAKRVSEDETNAYLGKRLGELVSREMGNVYNEQSYQTIVTRIKADLITIHQFITSESVKKTVIDILEDWTIDVKSVTQQPQDDTDNESNSQNRDSDNVTEPQDFND